MADQRNRLETYRSRRDFARSPEPSGDEQGEWRKDDNPVFVVQQHDASSMHFDFRLQVGDALASWAVPRGPSTDPRERRLAVRTEDHPMEYADFEGEIPADQYGGGFVIVWDAGPYRPLRQDEEGHDIPVERALEDGQVEIWLEGRKIRGGYALIHAQTGGDEGNWLLVKMDDDAADARRNPVSTEPRSVLSGRTIDELEAESQDSVEK